MPSLIGTSPIRQRKLCIQHGCTIITKASQHPTTLIICVVSGSLQISQNTVATHRSLSCFNTKLCSKASKHKRSDGILLFPVSFSNLAVLEWPARVRVNVDQLHLDFDAERLLYGVVASYLRPFDFWCATLGITRLFSGRASHHGRR